jgi:hypothetical protein
MNTDVAEFQARLITLAQRANMDTQLTPLILSGNYTQVASAVLKNGTELVRELNRYRRPSHEPFSFDATDTDSRTSADPEDLVWLKHLQNLFAALPEEHRLAARRNLAVTQT